ncbi:prolyl oligopeptidase family serine peptidase [Catenulispora yoronensis]|uniref:Prolyl oligopeptidase family serine peptidase n=1 Tax=Catenulispora yoronensis TaxID=450799 RepID=A0ABP5F6K3_9ACTN
MTSDAADTGTGNESGTDTDDPYLWLEDVTSEEALTWVKERNAEAFAELAGTRRYDTFQTDVRRILDADDRIPYVNRYNEYLYNYWRDATNPRGLWRRTTLESYRTPDPEWEVLLDLDALAAAEDENWVWKGGSALYPDYDRVLIHLSRGGADATVVREWDLPTREFVPGGFTVPEAKTRISWIDQDHVHIGTDLGPGTLTDSGYPRQARLWERGTDLADAPIVFEGDQTDVVVRAWRDPTPGYVRHFAYRAPDFFTTQDYVRAEDGTYLLIDVPDDADTDIHRQWLLIRPRSAWTVNGTEHPAGSLLAAQFDDYLAGQRNLTPVFTPDAHTSLSSWWWTRGHLIISTMSDVKTVLQVLDPARDWHADPLPGVPAMGDAQIVDTDPHHGEEYWISGQSFTQPPTLLRGDLGESGESGDSDDLGEQGSASTAGTARTTGTPRTEPELLRQAPARFDSTDIQAEQYFATSADGTSVPYFVVGRHQDRPGPTLMTGYGGFEIAETPGYAAVTGHGWITRGGTYVVANIRGGGEYGPDWHKAAMREKRPRAYEDCAAVAQDLVTRGITTATQLGIRGGSNGGLLVGNMLVTYPHLFGAIVCEVPLLDMRRYHRLLAGASWMAEYGDPDTDDWNYLRTYSPYHLLQPDRHYPPVLVTTSTRDDRVHPAHARKMVARMLEHGLDVRYYENIEGGHGGAADNEQAARKWALVLEFLWRKLGQETDN